MQGLEPVTQMSVRVGKPPTSLADPGSDDERDKAIIRRGEAARTLREDFPDFFKRDWNCACSKLFDASSVMLIVTALWSAWAVYGWLQCPGFPTKP